MVRKIVIDLPIPPSVNRIYTRGRKGVCLSAAYARWLQEADVTVIENRQSCWKQGGTLKGPFAVNIELNNTHRGDGDNRIKALLDYAQSREYIENDKDCTGGAWMWVDPDYAPCGARLTIIEGFNVVPIP